MTDQEGALTDREEAGLRGPVQRCDNENLFVGPTGSEAALPQRPVPSYDSYDRLERVIATSTDGS